MKEGGDAEAALSYLISSLLATDQTADAATGDGVAGQVLGAVSAGDTSIDARNASEKVDLDTGGASADNSAATVVGLELIAGSTTVNAGDAIFIGGATLFNQQEGDNDADLAQAAIASSGDAVGGQIIGAVTATGGSASIVADNASKKVDTDTGVATANNDSAAFVGLNYDNTGSLIVTADATATANLAHNQQDGDNALASEQTADATTGDGVAGQVLGVVSAGDASLDARNRSEKVDLETGDASSDNSSAASVGLNRSNVNTTINNADATFTGGTLFNQLEGDNGADLTQTAVASSGDGVAGQVAGVVTSAGGSADVVADNASKKVVAETGNSAFDNDVELFVGLNFSAHLSVG